MVMRTKQYCDICEAISGVEEDPKALIIKEPKQPAFPQLIWTYYKKGVRLLKDAYTHEPQLLDTWLGAPNRLEFCSEHASDMNILLKGVMHRDYELGKVLDKLRATDRLVWAEKQARVRKKFEEEHKAWDKRQVRVQTNKGKK